MITLEKQLAEALRTIEQFKAASMLDVNGDPEAVTPAMAERNVVRLMNELDVARSHLTACEPPVTSRR